MAVATSWIRQHFFRLSHLRYHTAIRPLKCPYFTHCQFPYTHLIASVHIGTALEPVWLKQISKSAFNSRVHLNSPDAVKRRVENLAGKKIRRNFCAAWGEDGAGPFCADEANRDKMSLGLRFFFWTPASESGIDKPPPVGLESPTRRHQRSWA